MKKLRKPIYIAAGYNTISFGSGRKEFNPKKPMPGIEHYINEAGRGVIAQISDPNAIDEAVIGNFMAARFVKQGHLAALIPDIHPALLYKPCTRVEGACCSGGLTWVTAMKIVLADLADVVLAIGTEVQNSVKAVYGADILAGAGHYASERKNGHAYFFPSKFDERAAACYEKFGHDYIRKAMALWYKQAIENARKNPKAQEYHNTIEDLFAAGMTPPNPKTFLPNLNVFDCSKVSDGASALIVASEEGLKKIGIPKSKAIQIVGYGQSEGNITQPPEDKTKLSTTISAAKKAYEMTGLTPKDIGTLEVHDCFSITGLLMLEACGFVGYGEGAAFVADGRSNFAGELPTNTTGGLIGFGHYTGGTGVRQVVDLLHQLTGQTNGSQIKLNPNRPFGMMTSMGGNDKTVVVGIFRAAA